jgi:hypothetical protein
MNKEDFRERPTQDVFDGDKNAAVESAGGCKIAIISKIYIISVIYKSL